MYVIGADSSEEQTIATEELAESSSLASWVWKVGVESMPDFLKNIMRASYLRHQRQHQEKSHKSYILHKCYAINCFQFICIAQMLLHVKITF